MPALIVGMLVTGVANSIFNKYQDMQCVNHCRPGDKRRQDFTQPVWQVRTVLSAASSSSDNGRALD